MGIKNATFFSDLRKLKLYGNLPIPMNDLAIPSFWKKCSSCKTPILFSQKYWVCSVSTCTRPRTGLVFCKVSCFDAHVPMMNHKDAGAFEKRAPTISEWKNEQLGEGPAPMTRQDHAQSASAGAGAVKREILVVVSKTKDYVRNKHQLNTAEEVMEVLSDKIRSLLDEASKKAIQDGRKTLMERDFR